MEITPVTPAIRTRKVRTIKAIEPKSGSKAKAPARAAASKPTKPAVSAKSGEAPKPIAKRKTLTKKPVEASKPTSDLTHMIAMAAYFLAEQRHFAPGYELQDWLTAERMIHSGETAP
jgi:hypothetical protein